jgi:hypothetical protein
MGEDPWVGPVAPWEAVPWVDPAAIWVAAPQMGVRCRGSTIIADGSGPDKTYRIPTGSQHGVTPALSFSSAYPSVAWRREGAQLQFPIR